MKGRLLLIDDIAVTREALAASLRERGWHVELAPDGRSGIDIAREHKPDVIVTELLLPDFHEFQFARAIRSCVEHDVLVVGMTQLPAAIHTMAKRAGYDEVVHKPLDVDAFASVLDRAKQRRTANWS